MQHVKFHLSARQNFPPQKGKPEQTLILKIRKKNPHTKLKTNIPSQHFLRQQRHLNRSDAGSGEIGWLLTMGALPQEGHKNISSPCLRLPISLLCRLPSWGGRVGIYPTKHHPLLPPQALWSWMSLLTRRAASSGAGIALCWGRLCPEHSETHLAPSSLGKPQDLTSRLLRKEDFSRPHDPFSWPPCPFFPIFLPKSPSGNYAHLQSRQVVLAPVPTPLTLIKQTNRICAQVLQELQLYCVQTRWSFPRVDELCWCWQLPRP